MSIYKDFTYHIKQADIVDISIYLLIFFYVISLFYPALALQFFSLSSDWTKTGSHPWTLISYSLLHGSLFHILINLLVLYYLGNLFTDFFSYRQFVLYYLAGVVAGALGFELFYYWNGGSGYLIGASAAVTAVMTGIAAKIPHYALKIRFVGSVELWVLTLIWVLLSVIGMGGVNAGGAAAHLAGALIGYLFTTLFKEGEWILPEHKEDSQVSPFSKIYRRNTEETHTEIDKKRKERKINEILDKINKSGYDSLTQSEKDFLLQQTDDR